MLRSLVGSEMCIRDSPPAGILSLKDPETGEEIWINSSDPKLRKAYQEVINNEQKELQEFFRECNCDYLMIKTSDSYVSSLRKFFALIVKRR